MAHLPLSHHTINYYMSYVQIYSPTPIYSLSCSPTSCCLPSPSPPWRSPHHGARACALSSFVSTDVVIVVAHHHDVRVGSVFCRCLYPQTSLLSSLSLSRWLGRKRPKRSGMAVQPLFRWMALAAPDQLPNWAKWWLLAQLGNDHLHRTSITLEKVRKVFWYPVTEYAMKILTIIGFFYVLQKSMYLPWDNIAPLCHGCSAVSIK